MSPDTTPTTITVPTDLRRMLDRYKRLGRETDAAVLLHLIEEVPTDRFLRELDRVAKEGAFVNLEELEKDPGFY